MRLAAAIVLAVCGCGRYGFDGVAENASGDATGTTDGDPGGPCVWGPWSAPTIVEGFESSDWERSPAQRADRLEVVFARYEVVMSVLNAQLWSAPRSSTAVAYGPDRAIDALNDPTSDDLDPTLSADGLVMLFTSNRTGARRAFETRRATPSGAFSPPALATGLESLTLFAPELTGDGLGVYFTVGNDLLVARRASLAQAFQSGTLLGFTGDSASVSADEREIYFVRSFALFVRTRGSTTEAFANEVEIVLPGILGTSAPDLSPDGRELLLILNDQLSRMTRSCT